MSVLWPGLFAAGIIVAISCGAKMPEEGEKWPDSVPIFLVGAAVSVVGLVGWRRDRSRQAAENAVTTGAGDAFALLEALLPPARQLLTELGELDNAQLCVRVDALLEDYVLPFAVARQQIIDRLGMRDGAEVLVVIAYGERMLNRVWSAASDGHNPEAVSVYPDALQAFEEAARLARLK
ncbi:MAG: hypothetical protein ACI8S6_005441 [Myxococcota bacterium]|jgi:hypothetical protein